MCVKVVKEDPADETRKAGSVRQRVGRSGEEKPVSKRATQKKRTSVKRDSFMETLMAEKILLFTKLSNTPCSMNDLAPNIAYLNLIHLYTNFAM